MWPAIGAVGGAAISAAGGMFGQKKANEANMKLQQNQLNWNKNMWHMNNEYNSPAAQMQRYREAGLNTHLMYGQGSEGNAGGPAQGVAPPQMQNVAAGLGQGVGSSIGSYIAMKKVNAEVENIEADTANKLTGADKNVLQGEGIAIDNQRAYLEYQYETKTFGNRISKNQIETTAAGLELVKLGLENEGKRIENDAAMMDLAYKELEKIISVTNSIADLQGTWLANEITAEELAYMKKWNRKMGTENPMVQVVKDLLNDEAGEIIEEGKKGLQERIVRGGARRNYRRNKRKYDGKGWGGVPEL